MDWTKDTLKETRNKARLSQAALAEKLGVHRRTIQNWEMGAVIPHASVLALDKVFDETNDYVPRKEYDKVVAALNAATDLNKKLTDILRSNIRIMNN